MSSDPFKRNLRTFDRKYKLQIPKTFAKLENKLEINVVNDKPYICTIKNVFTPKQCKLLIDETNKLGYNTMLGEYPPDIRDNKRILCMSDWLSEYLYNRIKHLLLPSNIKPDGFSTDGDWEFSMINPCFRFSRYASGSIGFKYHRDTSFIQDHNTRSIYSIICYLNDDFLGGNTTFYSTDNKRLKGLTVKEEMEVNKFVKIYDYKPEIGSVIIFNHNMIHCGEPLDDKSNPKYIFRSDLVFKNKNVIPYSIPKTSDYMAACQLMQQGGLYEMYGDTKKATECYERAVSIRQCQNDISCVDDNIYLLNPDTEIPYSKLLSQKFKQL